jgi:hypothetical protein
VESLLPSKREAQAAQALGRSYKDADIEFLEFIDEQLEARNV